MWFLLACSGPSSPAPGDDDDDDDDVAPTTEDTSTPPVTPGSPTLTVDEGYGDGVYAAGARAHVWAAVNPQTQIVTGWSAGGPDGEWNGELVMPDADLTVTPTFAAVAMTYEDRTYPLPGGNRRALVAAAPSPVGVVLFFHGAAYSVDNLHDNAASTIAMHFVRARYTVVAVESEAEAAAGTGGWNGAMSDANVDLQNVRALVEALRDDGTADGLPIVAWGMSSGGIMAHTVGAALPAETVVSWCAAANPEATAATSARTGWYLAGNDQVFSSAVVDAPGDLAELEARGVATDLYVHPPTPLYDQRFERIAGIDAARSAAIAASIRESGAVDDDDQWLVSGAAVTGAMALDGLDGLDAAQVAAVAAEIEIMAADHELYDDIAARMVAFVAAR